MGKLDNFADAGRKIAALIAPPKERNLAGMIYARRSTPTAAVNAEDGSVDARGLRFVNYGKGRYGSDRAEEIGKELLQNDGAAGFYKPFHGAAYHAGDTATRRHELFHAMVREAADDSSLRISPAVDALASIRNAVEGTAVGRGAARFAEELAAEAVGRRRMLSLGEIAKKGRTYGGIYASDDGIVSALPAYAVGVAAEPAVLASAATAGAMGLASGMYDGGDEVAAAELVRAKEEDDRRRGRSRSSLYHAEGRDGGAVNFYDNLIERLR